MTEKYVVVANDFIRSRVFGPFDSKAIASGFGLNHFGPSEMYAQWKWHVVPLLDPARANEVLA